MSDIRNGLKDLTNFARQTKGIVEMLPFLEDASRLESEVEQNAARNQKMQVEIAEAKAQLAGYKEDVKAVKLAAQDMHEDAKIHYNSYMADSEAEGKKVIAAAKRKAAEAATKGESNLKEMKSELKEYQKKLSAISKEVADEKEDLNKLRSRIARIKESL